MKLAPITEPLLDCCFIQAGSDFVMAATVSAGTWLNGTKMQLIREGKAIPVSAYREVY